MAHWQKLRAYAHASFSERTKAAVLQFQRDYKLKKSTEKFEMKHARP
jgi:hypothetical protein